jgi:hypothetical protein
MPKGSKGLMPAFPPKKISDLQAKKFYHYIYKSSNIQKDRVMNNFQQNKFSEILKRHMVNKIFTELYCFDFAFIFPSEQQNSY